MAKVPRKKKTLKGKRDAQQSSEAFQDQSVYAWNTMLTSSFVKYSAEKNFSESFPLTELGLEA